VLKRCALDRARRRFGAELRRRVVETGSTGEGAFLQFATEMFAHRAGFKYLHVPVKSATDIHTATSSSGASSRAT